MLLHEGEQDVLVGQFQQPLQCRQLVVGQLAEVAGDEGLEEDVQLLHAAPAAPAQP